jgi:hypothetical protein
MRTFPLALLSSTLVGVLLALVERIGMNKTALLDLSDIVGLRPYQKGLSSVLILLSFRAHGSYSSIAPPRISVSAEELDNFLDLVESFLPISAQNWQAVADVHLENYRREARTAESLRRKFQEISRRTGPTGDPNCPPYVIKAK